MVQCPEVYGGLKDKGFKDTMVKTSGKLICRLYRSSFRIAAPLQRSLAILLLAGFCLTFPYVTKNAMASGLPSEHAINPASIQATSPSTAPPPCVGGCLVCPLAEQIVNDYTTYRRQAHQLWMRNTIFPLVVDDLQDMTDQLSQNGPAVMQNIGAIADAVQQQRTQRRIQRLQFEANRRSQPSPKMCSIATMSNGLSATQSNGKILQHTLMSHSNARYNGKAGSAAELGIDADKRMRWNHYVTQFCSPDDENGSMSAICENNSLTSANKDADFAGTVGLPETIRSSDQDAVVMLSSYLYGHDLPHFRFRADQLDPAKNPDNFEIHSRMKRLYTLRGVALNSFSAFVAMKAEGPPESGEERARRMTTLETLGYEPEVVADRLTYSPSYVERMSLMQDALFNNPSFHIDNLTTDEQVQQVMLATRILDNMQLKHMLASQQRTAMLNAAWLELDARREQDRIQSTMMRENLREGRTAQ